MLFLYNNVPHPNLWKGRILSEKHVEGVPARDDQLTVVLDTAGLRAQRF
jgi:hypothetical protein